MPKNKLEQITSLQNSNSIYDLLPKLGGDVEIKGIFKGNWAYYADLTIKAPTKDYGKLKNIIHFWSITMPIAHGQPCKWIDLELRVKLDWNLLGSAQYVEKTNKTTCST